MDLTRLHTEYLPHIQEALKKNPKEKEWPKFVNKIAAKNNLDLICLMGFALFHYHSRLSIGAMEYIELYSKTKPENEAR